MDTNLTEFLFQKPLLVPYIEAYIEKIFSNLETIYPKKYI